MPVLPAELVEEILTALVDSYGDDPAYQWTQLRSLSCFQKHRIENHFRSFWLQKLTVEVYVGVWWSWKYSFDCSGERLREGIATFRHALDPRNSMNHVLKESFQNNPMGGRGLFLRFGEGHLNHGLKGGYIVSDIEPPGLTVSDDALTLRFEWLKTLNALLREEMLLRKHRKTMFEVDYGQLEEALHDSTQFQGPSEDKPNLNNYLIRRLRLEFQMASRVAVVRHRHARADPSGQSEPIFNETSSIYHRQQPNDKYSTIYQYCDRFTCPDIFEITDMEESMVPYLPEWQDMDDRMLYDLYAEEFGWSCCINGDKRDDLEFQKECANGWSRVQDTEEISRELRTTSHYHPLG